MAIEIIKYSKEYIGTAAELAAMTAADKLKVVAGSTFRVWDLKLDYDFANGDWRPRV